MILGSHISPKQILRRCEGYPSVDCLGARDCDCTVSNGSFMLIFTGRGPTEPGQGGGRGIAARIRSPKQIDFERRCEIF